MRRKQEGAARDWLELPFSGGADRYPNANRMDIPVGWPTLPGLR